jgi:hypothetical protein
MNHNLNVNLFNVDLVDRELIVLVALHRFWFDDELTHTLLN